MAAVRRLSGMQKAVLSLYKQCLRTVGTKPVAAQPDMRQYVRAEFDKWRHLKRTDVSRIEHLMRKGTRQHELLASDQCVSLSLSK